MLEALTKGPPAYAPNSGWPAWSVLPAAAGVIFLAIVAGGIAGWAFGLAAGTAVGQVVTVILTLAAGGLSPQKRKDVLALKPPAGGWGVIPLALLPLFGGTLVWTAAVLLLQPTAVYQDLRPFQQLLQGDTGWIILPVICLGAPLSEELLFRGFMFSGLAKSRLRLVGTAILTTVLWTALHAGYSAFGILEVLGIGLYFCWLLVRTGSLWVTIGCHAIYNTVVALCLLLVKVPAAA
jgi:CAAX protease family protein